MEDSERFEGEFAPPSQVRELSEPLKVSGFGWIDITKKGLSVSAFLHPEESSYPPGIMAYLCLGASIAGYLLVRQSGYVLLVGGLIAAALWYWDREKRAPVFVLGWRIPWENLVHLEQLARDPKCVLVRIRTPEIDGFYFRPRMPPEHFLKTIEQVAPSIRREVSK